MFTSWIYKYIITYSINNIEIKLLYSIKIQWMCYIMDQNTDASKEEIKENNELRMLNNAHRPQAKNFRQTWK